MSSYFVKQLYVLLLLLLHGAESILSAKIKCIESEREALLNFKHGLIDRSGMLSSWRDDENNNDCCKWRGIQCNNQTGHVLMLHLPGQYPQRLKGIINITALIVLQNIQHLDLSQNNFLWSQIPKLISSFCNIRYLNVSYSFFDGRIPCELGKLTHLQYLDLSYNYLYGELPYQLGNLSQLRILDLSQNNLNGKLPYQLGNLSQLRYLGLAGNSFSGALPFHVGNLPLLHTLRLAGNFHVKFKDARWLSSLYSLTILDLNYFDNLGTSYYWLQVISKLLQNLKELRLSHCSISDTNLQSLFNSHSNLSTSLIILDLSYNMLTSSTFQLLLNLCRRFPSLVILDLSYNNMTSSVFQGRLNLSSKLQNLNFQDCSLTDRSFIVSPTSITNSSSSLVSVDLSFNLLKSSTIFYWLFNSTANLHTLDLSRNMLEGPIPDGVGKNMSTLQSIDLSDNNLQGEIPSLSGNMCALQSIDFSNNKLNGTISSFIENSSWCNRHIFQRLYLSYNHITGQLPKSIGLLSELVSLSLAGNYLEGEVTELHLSNFSNLEDLSLSGKSFSLKLVPNWVPPFQLEHLHLRSCNLGPNFPSWIQSQRDLINLDISNNGINDSAPDSFWNNLQQMEFLNMSHNNLEGAIPNISVKNHIFLNSNQFEGKVPSLLRQAIELTLSENKLSDLSSFLCDESAESNLNSLDLSNNQITGQLPDCWKSFKQLVYLDLRNNKLSGKIPLSMGTLVNLELLFLRNNSLMSELPSTLKNCRNLRILDVGENMLTGPIPSWIGSMQQLIILNLEGNHFSGNIPNHLCNLKHIQLLDLSRNHLSTGIPTCLNFFIAMTENSTNRSHSNSFSTSFRFNYITFIVTWMFNYISIIMTWMWKGVEERFMYLESNRNSIDLSCNNLTGEIPKEVGYLLGLISLNLSGNNLSGEIPLEIGNLSLLESLDLSRNHLSGAIPSSISEIDDLGKLNLSHNSLSGRIPSGRHFDTFEASCFEGNVDLCGQQLNKSCPGDGDHTRTIKHEEAAVNDDDSVFYEALYMSLGLGYFTGFWGLLGPILIWRPWRNAYITFLNRITDYICVWL
ncbi:hypothetical protein Fmac_016068 [Flemingia macrophylla]|uniref:Uncharacterized protein n=1 Tax=Flemingia macrophylla TaxID=520843 RepID=A0ABD1MGD2_9FABA